MVEVLSQQLKDMLRTPAWVRSVPGIYPNLPRELYHAARGLISKSQIDLLTTPAEWRHWLTARRPDTDAMVLGDALHTMVLEPHEYPRRFSDLPRFGRSKREQAARRRVIEEAKADGYTLLSVEDQRTTTAMYDTLMGRPWFAALMERATTELSMVWVDEASGLRCKCRFDILDRTGAVPFAYDLKTTDDASPAGFRKSARRFSYHLQDAHYTAGAAANGIALGGFAFIVVSKKPPHHVGINNVSPRSIATARSIIAERLATLAHSLRTDTWPSYDAAGPVEIDIADRSVGDSLRANPAFM